MKTTFKIFITAIALMISNHNAGAQCASAANIYPFVYNGQNYEVIKENKTWIDAAACAVERGGILTEINDDLEQGAIFNELNSNANITTSNTIAPDGGGGAYAWIGGNDLTTEGTWIWDGNNDGTGAQFWMGDYNGSAVGGLYNNWGNEPDDYGGQDALGLSLNGWPLGVAGEWNDVAHTNTLYFVIEYSNSVGVNDIDFKDLKLFPNPVTDVLTIQNGNLNLSEAIISNAIGQTVRTIKLNNSSSVEIDLPELGQGLYFVKINSTNGKSIIKKFMK